MGGAGIGLYFHRLLNFAPRPLHDIFDAPSAAVPSGREVAVAGLRA
jgi:hypothetical protein